MTRRHRGTTAFSIYFFVFYMGMSIYTTYITIFFSARGLSQGQIGVISSVAPLVSMGSLYLFGRLADRTGRGTKLLALSFALSAVCLFWYTCSFSYSSLLVVNACYVFASAPLLQLSDAEALICCGREQTAFNRVKICGTAGYALIAVCAGLFFQGNVDAMFALCIGVFTLSGILALGLPGTQEQPKENRQKRPSYWKLFQYKKLVGLFALNLAVYIPISYYNSFFPIHLKAAAGGDLAIVGVSTCLSVVSEMPFLFFADRLAKKYGVKKLLLFSCGGMAARWLLTGLVVSPAALLAANCLKGISDIVVLYCTVTMIHRTADSQLKASGQAFLGILTYGVARIVGNYLGGLLADWLGTGAVFLLCAGLVAAAGGIFGLFYPGKTEG